MSFDLARRAAAVIATKRELKDSLKDSDVRVEEKVWDLHKKLDAEAERHGKILTMGYQNGRVLVRTTGRLTTGTEVRVSDLSPQVIYYLKDMIKFCF